MAHIGNRQHARVILDWHNDNWGNEDGYSPDEWEIVGSGSFRTAYLHIPTNVVYKVEDGSWQGYGSAQELRVAQSLRKNRTFKKVRIPLTSGFRFHDGLVLAMEAVKGESIGMFEDTRKARAGRLELFKVGFEDMHPQNFFIEPGGVVVPVDMASPIGRKNPDRRLLNGLLEKDTVRV